MSGDLPHSITQNTLTIMGVELIVHVLSNGQRIIEADGMRQLFEAMGAGAHATEDESILLARALLGNPSNDR